MILKKSHPTIPLYASWPNLLTRSRYWIGSITIVFILLVAPNNAYCFDTISLKQYSILNIPVPSKVDITKLPIGKTFQVTHTQFTLQFFFNNRDIFGFIFKRTFSYNRNNRGVCIDRHMESAFFKLL